MSYLCLLQKNLVIYGLPFRTENGSEREIPCKGPNSITKKEGASEKVTLTHFKSNCEVD